VGTPWVNEDAGRSLEDDERGGKWTQRPSFLSGIPSCVMELFCSRPQVLSHHPCEE
jgi:hypothetical protein